MHLWFLETDPTLGALRQANRRVGDGSYTRLVEKAMSHPARDQREAFQKTILPCLGLGYPSSYKITEVEDLLQYAVLWCQGAYNLPFRSAESDSYAGVLYSNHDSNHGKVARHQENGRSLLDSFADSKAFP